MSVEKRERIGWNLHAKYLTPKRMSSIGIQFQLCTRTQTHHFLDVGAAGGLLTWILNQNGMSTWSVDIRPVAGPDIVGALPRLPFKNNAVETSLCFQVLEHIPYTLLEPSLTELARVASRYVIISLPDFACVGKKEEHFTESIERQVKRTIVQVVGRTPFGPQRWREAVKSTSQSGARNSQSPPPIDPRHFWEVNHDHVIQQDIIDIGQRAGLKAVEVFNNEMHPYHLFFYFEKMTI